MTAADSGEARLVAAHDALMHVRGLQHDFPPPAALPQPPPWLRPVLEMLVAAAPVLQVIFWIGAAALAALILWLMVRDLPIARRYLRRKKADDAAQPANWRPEAGAAQALLSEADALAAAGRYDDAIHLLLFRSIAEIGATRPTAVRAALTSRDIVEAAPLSETGRATLRRIAQAVERSFFAGRPADRDAFDACRADYHAFALAEGPR